MFLDITNEELDEVYNNILTILGAYSVNVDITKEECLIMVKRANLEFQKETSIWQLRNQFANIYGTPAGLLQQNQIATMNFQLTQQITDYFSSQARVGGRVPFHKDYIILEPGRQVYDLSKESSKPYPPGTRRIHRVMWVAKPETLDFSRFSTTNPHGDDILYSSNWDFTTNGLNYGASPLAFLGYSMDTILLMQSAKTRSNILFSEFFHNLSGDILEITPMPGIGAAAFQPGLKVFYYYFEQSEEILNGRNSALNINGPASDTVGEYDLPAKDLNLIANPVDMKLNYVAYSALSDWARAWIFDYTLARCKYIQGSKWRTIKKTMSTGEMSYEIEFDYQSLLSEANNEIEKLISNLREDLKELNIAKLVQEKADMATAATKVSTRTPRLWKYI